MAAEVADEIRLLCGVRRARALPQRGSIAVPFKNVLITGGAAVLAEPFARYGSG